jgi:crotonobetainyl-CoA:carnitine CoA-transferase CaiB-like acyl-CoA transferase
VSQRALDAAGVPNAPVQSIDQALEHEQTRALGIMQTGPDGKLSLIGSPLSFDGDPIAVSALASRTLLEHGSFLESVAFGG